MEWIAAEWRRLNRPSPALFRKELLRRGVDIPADQLREFFYAQQSSKQLFAPGPKYKGKIFSLGPSQKWFADILIKKKTDDKTEYWLLVQDEFSRYAWEEKIANQGQAHSGLAKIFGRAGRTPEELVTDRDPGFTSRVFQQLLRDHGVRWVPKSGQQDIATVDRLGGIMKRARAEAAAEGHNVSMGEILEGQNDRLNATTHAAPNELWTKKPDKTLFFKRMWQEASALRDTVQAQQARGEHLANVGRFRVYQMNKIIRGERRIDEPIWSREVHRVRRIDGAYVEADDGRRYLTKEVLPVRGGAAVAFAPLPRPRARALLERYKDLMVEFLRGRGGKVTVQSLGRLLNLRAPEYKQTLRALRLSTRVPFQSFAKVYPELFETDKTHIKLVQ
jgi:hypothetical protein